MNSRTKKIIITMITFIAIIILLSFFNVIKNQICSVIMLEAIEEGDISKLEKTLTIGNPDYVPGNALIEALCDSPYKKSPLQLACYEGDMDMVKILVEKGADVNFVKSNAPLSPLMTAIMGQSEKDLEVVKYLIEQGADVNYNDYLDRTALYWLVVSRTVSENSIEILNCLVNAGADLEETNYLHYACVWKHNDIIKYFMDECDYSAKGGEVIQQYCRGVNSFSTEIFELLIQNGADIYETDENGKCAVDYLIETTEGDTYWVDVMESIYEEAHN